MPSRRWCCAALAVSGLMACHKDAGDDPPSPTPSLPTLDGRCPAGAATVGEADESVIVERELVWQFDPETELSFTAPEYFVLPPDTRGWAVTADAGDDKTGFARVWVDGSVVVDLDRPGDFGRRRRPPRAAGEDTAWDTWWDTFPDTFDSYWGDSAYALDSGWVDPAPGWGVWPLYHQTDVASTVGLPLGPALPARSGCLAVVPVVEGEATDARGRLALRVARGEATRPTLRVNLVVVQGAGISADALRAAGASMQDLYAAGGGPRLEVSVFDLAWEGDGLFGFGEDLHRLRSAEIVDGLDGALNLFVIRDFLGGGGTIGIAAGIPGPVGVDRTAGSGVVVTVDGHRSRDNSVDVYALGGTMAHEAAHQLGLFHTSEASGRSFDVLEDTPECQLADRDRDGDGTVYAGECRKDDGHNFMFWIEGGTRFDQREVTPDQAWLLNHVAAIGSDTSSARGRGGRP